MSPSRTFSPASSRTGRRCTSVRGSTTQTRRVLWRARRWAPAAIEYDAQVVNEGEGGGIQLPGQTRATAGSLGGFNINWDGTWTVATSVDSAGWYAEFRIPFTTLRYGASELQTWGLNLVRSIRRKSEEAFWSFIPRQFSLMKISHAGTLQGVHVPSRRVWTMTPYALTGVERNYSLDPEAHRRGDVGGE